MVEQAAGTQDECFGALGYWLFGENDSGAVLCGLFLSKLSNAKNRPRTPYGCRYTQKAVGRLDCEPRGQSGMGVLVFNPA